MRQEALQSFDFLFEDSMRRLIEANRGGVERVTQSSGELNRLWDFPRRRIVGRGLWRKFKGARRKTGRKLW